MKKLIVLLSAVIAVVQKRRSAPFFVKGAEGAKKSFFCGKVNGGVGVYAGGETKVGIFPF